MRRSRTVLSLVLAGIGAGVLGGAAPPALAAAPPRASLTPIACHSTLDPAARRVSVTSVMRHRPGTRSLAVRVTLLETQPGQTPEPVAGGDLGHWVSPAVRTLGQEPDDVWRLAKSVYDVDAPARYRFAVQFRWEGRGGRVLATQTRVTGSCGVRELRPDVLVRSVTVIALSGRVAHDRYVAQIANRGATASGPFSVLFTPGAGLPSQTQPVASLTAGRHERVTFLGPVCDPAAPPTVVADPTDQVDDYDRTNNTLMVTCPAA